jgi:hypothetical protein
MERSPPDTGIRQEHVDAALGGLHGVEEPIQIARIRDVALDNEDVTANDLDGLIQLLLPPAGDHDLRAFGDEPPGAGQAYVAVATGNDRCLAFEPAHVPLRMVINRRGRALISTLPV